MLSNVTGGWWHITHALSVFNSRALEVSTPQSVVSEGRVCGGECDGGRGCDISLIYIYVYKSVEREYVEYGDRFIIINCRP